MAAEQIHNLDEGLSEYFTFIVNGHSYECRYLTTSEYNKFIELSNTGDEPKTRAYLFGFIKKVDEKSPDFGKTYEDMGVHKYRKWREMIFKELGGV